MLVNARGINMTSEGGRYFLFVLLLLIFLGSDNMFLAKLSLAHIIFIR